jgi:dihydropteroate synthase
MVNDVNALRAEDAVETCASLNVPVCLMHMQGEPRTMQQSPEYEDVVREVKEFLQQRTEACLQAGIHREQIVLDPGFGFGKTLEHNISLFNQLDAICELDLPVLVGISRKSMLGAIVDKPVEQRLAASIAAAVLAWSRGVRIFRVHDVAETRDALKLCEALKQAE